MIKKIKKRWIRKRKDEKRALKAKEKKGYEGKDDVVLNEASGGLSRINFKARNRWSNEWRKKGREGGGGQDIGKEERNKNCKE